MFFFSFPFFFLFFVGFFLVKMVGILRGIAAGSGWFLMYSSVLYPQCTDPDAFCYFNKNVALQPGLPRPWELLWAQGEGLGFGISAQNPPHPPVLGSWWG